MINKEFDFDFFIRVSKAAKFSSDIALSSD
jgi:hypothetical protein